jgi:pimeloyl-ACP methyl ester carboxylesterase
MRNTKTGSIFLKTIFRLFAMLKFISFFSFSDSMISHFSLYFRRRLSTAPTSNFITLPNRPIVQTNGETAQGSLKLHYWEWKGHQPTILFCHAASFHGRCYDHIINEALHGFHVIALDFRGHSRSQKHRPPYCFRWFGEDLSEFIETLNLPKNKLIGIGHSVGGYALTWAAAKASRCLFQSLLLLDPAIVHRSYYEDPSASDLRDVNYILRRRNQWSSIEDMISRLEKRELFLRWPKDTLRDYCTYAVDKNYKLICAPDEEASIYKLSMESDSNIYPLIEQSKFIHDIPIHIIRSSIANIRQLESSPTEPSLFKCFKNGRDTQLENCKHLFPMEEPQLVIDLVKEFIKEIKTL